LVASGSAVVSSSSISRRAFSRIAVWSSIALAASTLVCAFIGDE
jgi:hypothetical protein